MNTLQKLHSARTDIDKLLDTLIEARHEVEEQIQAFKRHDTELPRKTVARMIGCTPEHVSWLKSQGRLASYRYSDVMDYINTH